jgi:hypothetical protein
MPENTTPEPIGIVGLGRVGSHAARQLRTGPAPLRVYDTDRARRDQVLDMLRPLDGPAEPNGGPGTTVILATPAGNHGAVAAALVRSGISVVSSSDDPVDVYDLLQLHDRAIDSGTTVVAGAGLSPGFSCLQTLHASRDFDDLQEISVWTTGTAGPACARRHHRCLQLPAPTLVDGHWVDKRPGSGRDLAWFPGSLGALDCYRGALAEPMLLHRLFPTASRISARTAATRRDRLTGRLPMLRRPHADGGPGGVRIEVRGLGAKGYQTDVVGTMVYPSVAAGTVAAVVAEFVHHGDPPRGAMGVAELASNPSSLLAELHRRGLTAARFHGSR